MVEAAQKPVWRHVPQAANSNGTLKLVDTAAKKSVTTGILSKIGTFLANPPLAAALSVVNLFPGDTPMDRPLNHPLKQGPADPSRGLLGIERAGKTIRQIFNEFREMVHIMQLILMVEMQLAEQSRLGNHSQIQLLKQQLQELHSQAQAISFSYQTTRSALKVFASASSDDDGNSTTTAPLQRRAGIPTLDEIPERVDHVRDLLLIGLHRDIETIYRTLDGVVERLSVEWSKPLLASNMFTIELARTAAERYLDARFIRLAQQLLVSIPLQFRIPTQQRLDTVMANLATFTIPEDLLSELQTNIQSGNEAAAEIVADHIVAHIFSAAHLLFFKKEWPIENILLWAESQIKTVRVHVTSASTSEEQRQLTHDIKHILVDAYNQMQVAALQSPAQFGKLLGGLKSAPVSQSLAEMLAVMRNRSSRHVSLVAEGIEAATLADDVDPRQVQIILRNLIRNAGDHPQPGQSRVTVRVTLTPSAQGNTLSISDNGMGMSPETIAYLASGTPLHNGTIVDHSNPDEVHGFGWKRIHAACHQLGIVPEIKSTPGLGTTVTLKIPPGILR